jgi:ATP-dependent Lon protease
MEDLLKKGLSLLKLATEFDSAGQTQQAISHYLLALDVLVKCHGYEKLETNRALLKEKISLYMTRVEVLKGHTSSAVPRSVSTPSIDPISLPSPPSDVVLPQVPSSLPSPVRRPSAAHELPACVERSVALAHGQTGVSYASLFGVYLKGSVLQFYKKKRKERSADISLFRAVRVTIEDPFLSSPHQLRNLVALVELICTVNDGYEILVVTRGGGGDAQVAALEELRNSLRELGGGLVLSWRFSETLHDRALRLSNGWKIVLGRGLDLWQKPPAGFGKYFIGVTEQSLRRTQECEVHFMRE